MLYLAKETSLKNKDQITDSMMKAIREKAKPFQMEDMALQ